MGRSHSEPRAGICPVLDFSPAVIGFPAPTVGLWRGGLPGWDGSPVVLPPGTAASITRAGSCASPGDLRLLFPTEPLFSSPSFPTRLRCWVLLCPGWGQLAWSGGTNQLGEEKGHFFLLSQPCCQSERRSWHLCRGVGAMPCQLPGLCHA